MELLQPLTPSDQTPDSQNIYLSIVIPLYNEQDSVTRLVQQTIAALDSFDRNYELILVDDGSTDGTWESIVRLKTAHPVLRGIKFRKNFGQTSAMVAGFDNARGEVIVTMDGDLQNDPADIPVLLEKMKEGYELVSGWRKDRKDHWSRVFPSKVANWIISTTTGVKLHDYGCSLKAYKAESIKPIKAYGEMHRFFPALASMTGARVFEVPVKHHPRKYGSSKYGFNRIFKVFSDLFSMNLIIRFSSTPLLGFALSALPFLLFTLFFSAISIVALLEGWTAGKTGFFAILAGLNLMPVIVLNSLGILGELIVANSDLTHEDLPEFNKRFLAIDAQEEFNESKT